VLFLDALDEDTKAIEDNRIRLLELVRQTSEFRHILITCRTQFSPKDEEIPTETGLLKVVPVAPGESRGHYFYKLYLSPFSDRQVNDFISKRFTVRRARDRKKLRGLPTR
jgi:hypothetical protein